MRIRQTFWTNNITDLKTLSKGWINVNYFLMSWTLSALQLRKYYDNVKLVTDDFGEELLINVLKLPYTEVSLAMNNYQWKEFDNLWGLRKIYSCTTEKFPFINVDGDAFLFKPLPSRIIKGELISQNQELEFDFYQLGLKNFIRNFKTLPKHFLPPHGKVIAHNSGIVGGNNFQFFTKLFNEVLHFCKSNVKALKNDLDPTFSLLIEQYYYARLADHYNISIESLHDPVYRNQYTNLVKFHLMPFSPPILHVMAAYKNNEWVCQQMVRRLELNFPDFYSEVMTKVDQLTRRLVINEKQDLENHSVFFRTERAMQILYNRKYKIGSYQDLEVILKIKEKYRTTIDQKRRIIDVFRFERDLNDFQKRKVDYKTIRKTQLRTIQHIDDFGLSSNSDKLFNISNNCHFKYSRWDWSKNPDIESKLNPTDDPIHANLITEPNDHYFLFIVNPGNGFLKEYKLNSIGALLIQELQNHPRSLEGLYDALISKLEIYHKSLPNSKNKLKEKILKTLCFLIYLGAIV